MQRLVPTVWCPGNATELADFYAAALPDVSRGDTFTLGADTNVASVDVDIAGFTLTLLNARLNASTAEHRPKITPAVSFLLNFGADEAELLDATYAQLSTAGEVLMPLQEYGFSPLFAWVADKFGLSWQIAPTHVRGLLGRPGAVDKLAEMGKLVLADFPQQAGE